MCSHPTCIGAFVDVYYFEVGCKLESRQNFNAGLENEDGSLSIGWIPSWKGMHFDGVVLESHTLPRHSDSILRSRHKKVRLFQIAAPQ